MGTILGLDINGSIKIDDLASGAGHFDLGITGAATITCSAEAFTLSGSTITVPGVDTAGDCAHDQLDKAKVSLESISYDSGADTITVNVKKSIVKVSLVLAKGGFVNPPLDRVLQVIPTFAAPADACSYTDQTTCDGDSGCTWCKCAALPSRCWTKSDAAKLPAGVYVCDSTKPTFLRGAKIATV